MDRFVRVAMALTALACGLAGVALSFPDLFGLTLSAARYSLVAVYLFFLALLFGLAAFPDFGPKPALLRLLFAVTVGRLALLAAGFVALLLGLDAAVSEPSNRAVELLLIPGCVTLLLVGQARARREMSTETEMESVTFVGAFRLAGLYGLYLLLAIALVVAGSLLYQALRDVLLRGVILSPTAFLAQLHGKAGATYALFLSESWGDVLVLMGSVLVVFLIIAFVTRDSRD